MLSARKHPWLLALAVFPSLGVAWFWLLIATLSDDTLSSLPGGFALITTLTLPALATAVVSRVRRSPLAITLLLIAGAVGITFVLGVLSVGLAFSLSDVEMS